MPKIRFLLLGGELNVWVNAAYMFSEFLDICLLLFGMSVVDIVEQPSRVPSVCLIVFVSRNLGRALPISLYIHRREVSALKEKYPPTVCH